MTSDKRLATSNSTKALVLFLAMFWLATSAHAALANTINHCGKDYWINGANIPWNQYGTDVGVHPDWGSLHDPIWFESHFTDCEAHGINTLRWWLHCDGRSSPEWAGDESVTGLDAGMIAEMDDIITRAANHKIMLIICLWDFGMCDTVGGCGPEAGQHSDLLRDPAKVQTYIDNALVPMVTGLAGHTNILAWEVINEPAWACAEPTVADPVTNFEMQRFVAMQAAAIHQNCSEKVTVGEAYLKWNSNCQSAIEHLWEDADLIAAHPTNDADAYLDFYQVHYYDWMYNASWGYDPNWLAPPPPRDPVYWCLDKPTIIGEAPGADGQYTLTEMLDNPYTNGYAGQLFWSYNSDWDWNWANIADELLAFRNAHAAEVDFSCTLDTPTVTMTYTGTPTRSITPTASPTATVSASHSSTASRTATLTATRTATASSTPTATRTASETATASASDTPSATPSVTLTMSETATPSASHTPSVTSSVTLSVSETATPSTSHTPSVTSSVTPSVSETGTASASRTPSYTPSHSMTTSATATVSASRTRSWTRTATLTATPTFTPPPTLTVTWTYGALFTGTATPTITPDVSATPSPTPGELLIEDHAFYPNPFSGDEAYFTYRLSAPADEVRIKVFTVSGRLVVDLLVEDSFYGEYESIIFTGRDNWSNVLADGVYLYLIEASRSGMVADRKIGKLVILR